MQVYADAAALVKAVHKSFVGWERCIYQWSSLALYETNNLYRRWKLNCVGSFVLFFFFQLEV